MFVPGWPTKPDSNLTPHKALYIHIDCIVLYCIVLYRVFQKKTITMFVCLISPKPIKRFLNRFFLLRSMCKFWIQNHLCVLLGGWDICKPKWDSETDTIILVMTWSGLSCARLASRCPYWSLPGLYNPWETSLGNFGPHRVWPGQSAVSWGISRPVWYCENHFRSV